MRAGYSGKWLTNTLPLAGVFDGPIYYVNPSADGNFANGGIALPFNSAQVAVDADGGCGGLIVMPGSISSIDQTGNAQNLSIVGQTVAQDCELGGIYTFVAPVQTWLQNISLENNASFSGAFLEFYNCEFANASTPQLITGLASVIALRMFGCYVRPGSGGLTLSGFPTIEWDDISERNLLVIGSILDSGTLIANRGALANGLIVNDAAQVLNFSRRAILPATKLTANRVYTLDLTGTAVGDTLTFDSYNNSGHTATINGVVDASAPGARRYRCVVTVAGVTAVVQKEILAA